MARFEIVNGPSKFDLMLALFDGNCDHRRIVDFTLLSPQKEHKTFSCIINDLKREDGSGESWLFAGYFGVNPLHGYFSTKHRKGWIKFREDE